ncbi:MAG TPA: sortase [Dehalococcoidia bacterium]|nr:sortase [Dehalococcoidia bacterium]
MLLATGCACLILLVGLLLASPVIDQVQRLSRPTQADQAFSTSVAAETSLDGIGGLSRTPVRDASGSLPRLPARSRSAAASPAPGETVPEGEDSPSEIEVHPGYGEPTWMTIPAIDLDSPVDSVGTSDGYYQTARFRVGHHEDSAPPGAIGNSVYNGHVTSLTDGRVFARLTELEADDMIAIYTDTHRTEWQVIAAGWVGADEDWYIQPAGDIRATFYTCAGDFDFGRRDYTHRYVVIAGLAGAVLLDEEEKGGGEGGE